MRFAKYVQGISENETQANGDSAEASVGHLRISDAKSPGEGTVARGDHKNNPLARRHLFSHAPVLRRCWNIIWQWTQCHLYGSGRILVLVSLLIVTQEEL